MVITDYYMTCKNGVQLYRTYSDMGFKILQHPTEIIYDEAIDTIDAPYTYTETDQLIGAEEEDDNNDNNDEEG